MQWRVGGITVSSNASGHATFDVEVTNLNAPGFLAATATVAGSTSELGSCLDEPPVDRIFFSGFEN
jgi:hypothetical protein